MIDIGYVYGLFDPAEQAIRYVGQSYKPRVRLSTHQTLNDKNRNTPTKRWMAAMLPNYYVESLRGCPLRHSARSSSSLPVTIRPATPRPQARSGSAISLRVTAGWLPADTAPAAK